ncbi:MAG: hypothetical protein AABY54_04765 [Deltaproteobacteria bacterium]
MHDNFDSAFDELLEKGFIEYVEKRPDGEPEYRLTAKGIKQKGQLDLLERKKGANLNHP